MEMSLSILWEIVQDKEAWCVAIHGSQRVGHNLVTENNKAVHCSLLYLTYIQSTSCKILGWMNHKLESGEISTILDMQMIF